MLALVALLVVAVIGVLIMAAMRPNEFSVQRSIGIRAPADRIFPLIVDFRQWPAWSPWEKIDPTVKRTLSGAARGPGAVYEWQGSVKVGPANPRQSLRASGPSRPGFRLEVVTKFNALWTGSWACATANEIRLGEQKLRRSVR